MLDIRQRLEPGDHDLGLDLDLDKLLRQCRYDVRQRQPLRYLECVDGGQTGCDVACAEECVQDLLDGVGGWRGNAVVDGLCCDGLADDVGFGDLRTVARLEGRT